MDTFENIKTGDKVWDIRWGWGEVTEQNLRQGNWPITVFFASLDIDSQVYNIHGVGLKSVFRTLFWNKVEIKPPGRPKKIKKTIEGWIEYRALNSHITSHIYHSKQEIEANSPDLQHIHIKHDYWVVE